MRIATDVLQPGSCETLKAGVHATALGLAVVMGVYNAAAWFRRRERHLAINTVLYAALTAWEQKNVAHHLESRRRCRELEAALSAVEAEPTPTQSVLEETPKPNEVAAA